MNWHNRESKYRHQGYQTEWLMIPACPSLMRSLNAGNIEGTDSSKTDVWCLYMDFCFIFAKWLVFWSDYVYYFEFWDWIMSSTRNLQRGTADAEIKAPSVENPGLTNVLPRKPGVGQNIATHASPYCQEVFPCRNVDWPREESLGMSGISGLSFDSPFLSPLLFFCLVLLLFLSCHFSANGPFSWLFPPENSQIFFVNG